MRRITIAFLLGVAGLVPAAAYATQPAVIAKVEQLQQGKGVKTGYEMTPALSALAAATPMLKGDDRRQAESILARPDDSQADPAGTHKWTGLEAPGSPMCSAHFCVHWTAVGGDASNSTNAAEMLGILENEVFPCENGTGATSCAGSPGLGWREPTSDLGKDGNDSVDVYIEDLYTNERVFGYVAMDPGQAQDPSVPHYSYMVLDKDYSRFGDGTAASGKALEQVTIAHEYNHVLQNVYDYLEDSWMFEATAVYMEDKVYPSNNDYLHYVSAWVVNTKQPLTLFSRTNLKPYGSAVWNHWLDHRFGPAAVRAAWEQSIGASNFAPAAYGAAVAAQGVGGFTDEFDRFASAVPEWDVPGEGFPDTYPDVPRDGTLPVATQTTPFPLAHTTFALFDVPIPADAPRKIRVTATLPSGVAGAVALVGRIGGALNAGDVTTSLTSMPSGGTAAANLDNPAQFGRITAVVVNSDPSHGAFDSTADDYVFTKDATGVVAATSEPGPAIPTTGAAALISDHGAFVNATVDPHLNDTTWQIEYGRSVGYGSETKAQSLPESTVGAAQLVSPLHNLSANATYHYRVLASNAAGVTAGRDMTFRTLRDVTKPTVVVKVGRQRLGRVRARGLAYLIRCSEHCRGRAELVLGRSTARALGLPMVLGKSSVSLSAHASSRTLHVRLGGRAKRRFAALARGLRAQLRVSVADDARNRRTVTVSARLSR